jgi:hypothetical protein
MDGRVSGTGIHLDLMAGARRVLVLALKDGSDLSEGMMTSHPGGAEQELADLEASGTSVMLRVPEQVDILELMAPSSVPKALAMGERQASADVGLLSTFWASAGEHTGARTGAWPLEVESGPLLSRPRQPGRPRQPLRPPDRPPPGRGPR